jgi:hypothetical protein
MDRLVLTVLILGCVILLCFVLIQHPWIGSNEQESTDKRAKRELQDAGLTCEAFMGDESTLAEVTNFDILQCGGFKDGPPGMYQLKEKSCYMSMDHETVNNKCSMDNAALKDPVVKSIRPTQGGTNCIIEFHDPNIPETYLTKVREEAPSVIALKAALADAATRFAVSKTASDTATAERDKSSKALTDAQKDLTKLESDAANLQTNKTKKESDASTLREAALAKIEELVQCNPPSVDEAKSSVYKELAQDGTSNFSCVSNGYVYKGPKGIHSAHYQYHQSGENLTKIQDLAECAYMCDGDPECKIAHIWHPWGAPPTENYCKKIKETAPWNNEVENNVEYYIKIH